MEFNDVGRFMSSFWETDAGREIFAAINHTCEMFCFFSDLSKIFLPHDTFLLQGSQGYGSTESDFVEMETFPSLQNTDTSSLPELNLVGQVCGDHTYFIKYLMSI